MSKIELKSCPFCGKAGLLVMANSGTSLHPTRILNSYYIRCAGCSVRTPAYDSDIRQEDDGTITIKANGAELAAEVWNKRTELPSCYQPRTAIKAHNDLDPVILNKISEILDSVTELAHMLKQKQEGKKDEQ